MYIMSTTLFDKISTPPKSCIQTEIPISGFEPITSYTVKGKHSGKHLVITAGVHGCEYVGILALYAFLSELDADSMHGSITAVPIVNISGFFTGSKQTVPEDGINLNRAFPADQSSFGGKSALIARAVQKHLYKDADFLIDLHSADINEKITPLLFFPVDEIVDESVRQKAKAAAEKISVPLRVASRAKNGLYSYAAITGIPSLLLERGGMGVWSESEVSECVKNLKELAAHLSILDLPDTYSGEKTAQRKFTKNVYDEACDSGLWFPLVHEGQKVKKGDVLGKLYTAQKVLIKEYTAEFDAEIMYFTLSLGVSKGDPLVAYGAES